MLRIFLLCFLAAAQSSEKITLTPTDYYWREYDGFLPDDAFVGGYDKGGHDTYVGQAFVPTGAIVPVTLKPHGNNFTRAAYKGVVHNISTYNKALCSENLRYFQWIPVTAKTVQLLTNYTLAVGGADNRCLFKIGRVKYQGEMLVGRVTCDLDNAVLYVAHDLQEVPASTYEILVYSHERVNVDYPKTLKCEQ